MPPRMYRVSRDRLAHRYSRMMPPGGKTADGFSINKHSALAPSFGSATAGARKLLPTAQSIPTPTLTLPCCRPTDAPNTISAALQPITTAAPLIPSALPADGKDAK